MPRKTDGIPFQLQPRPTRNEDGQQLLYARLLPGRRMKLEMVDDMFTQGRSYRLGDFKRMMETFIELFGRYIAMGYRIEPPLGSFAPKLRTHGDYTSPEQVSNGSVIDMATCWAVLKKRLKEEGAVELLTIVSK